MDWLGYAREQIVQPIPAMMIFGAAGWALKHGWRLTLHGRRKLALLEVDKTIALLERCRANPVRIEAEAMLTSIRAFHLLGWIGGGLGVLMLGLGVREGGAGDYLRAALTLIGGLMVSASWGRLQGVVDASNLYWRIRFEPAALDADLKTRRARLTK